MIDVKTLPRLLAFLALLLAPATASAEWHEASSAHFRIYSEGSAEAVRALAERLERFDKGMHVLNGLPQRERRLAGRVTIFVLSDADDVRRLARGRSGIRGFYISRAQGPVAFTPRRTADSGPYDFDAETILLHEYAHHFMRLNYQGAFPAWFIEGFAEFNATARFHGNGGVDFGLPADHRAFELRAVRDYSVESLFSGAAPGPKQAGPAGLYARGWLLTHYLMLDQKRRGQFAAYVNALNRGTPNLEAARTAFGDFRSLDRELAAYAGRSKLPGIAIAPEALAIGPVAVRPLSAGESAMMRFRPRIERGPSRDEVAAMLPEIRAAAAPFPNDPAVQALLAEVENRAGNRAEAEAAADRALAADPVHRDALIARAWVAIERARESGGQAAWRAARKHIAAANRNDPDDPEPLMLFYRSFEMQGVKPNANAVAGLLRAQELAPYDQMLRMSVGRLHLAEGRGPEARAVLAPIAFDPHGGARAEAVRRMLARLDEAGAEAALAASPAAGADDGD